MINIFSNILVNGKIRKSCVLDNAFDVEETQKLNGIYEFKFSLPNNEENIEYCNPFCYAQWEDTGALYRIIKHGEKADSTGVITYNCEHVICTLVDSVLFGSYGISDLQKYYNAKTIYTEQWIEWLLSKQTTVMWKLGQCDFHRKFEYAWEQESLLNALYSIAEPFSDPYKWTFDTTEIPWTVNLIKIDTTVHPEFYVRAEKNLLSEDTESNNEDITTRIYPLGYGEGVNQLTIADVNNGIKYLQNNEAIAKYGIIEKVLVDRRFENSQSLKDYAQQILNGLSCPTYSRTFGISDLNELSNVDIDKAEVGKIVKLVMDDTTTYITKTVKKYDVAGDLKIELSTSSSNVVDQIADLVDRIRIESTYSQGATQLYQHSKDENASPEHGMEIKLYFPSEMKQINKVLANIQIGKFRAYSQATEDGGSSVQTSSSGGSSTQTSSSGGASTQTSSNGGGGASTATSGSSSEETTGQTGLTGDTDGSGDIYGYTNSAEVSGETGYGGGQYTDYSYGSGSHCHYVSSHNHSFSASHSHNVTVSSHHHHLSNFASHTHGMKHTHSVTVNFPSHSHSISIPSHTHSVTIPSHTHDVTIPSHAHEITPGIYEFGDATGAGIYVNGTLKKTIETSWNDDITTWILNEKNTIDRDTWITIEIRPNDLAYINCSVFVQGFVNSRGGGNY